MPHTLCSAHPVYCALCILRTLHARLHPEHLTLYTLGTLHNACVINLHTVDRTALHFAHDTLHNALWALCTTEIPAVKDREYSCGRHILSLQHLTLR